MSDNETFAFDIIDAVTRTMLEESGEVQRAYTMAIIYENAYDFYIEKHNLSEDNEVSHIEANRFAMSIVAFSTGMTR